MAQLLSLLLHPAPPPQALLDKMLAKHPDTKFKDLLMPTKLRGGCGQGWGVWRLQPSP